MVLSDLSTLTSLTAHTAVPNLDPMLFVFHPVSSGVFCTCSFMLLEFLLSATSIGCSCMSFVEMSMDVHFEQSFYCSRSKLEIKTINRAREHSSVVENLACMFDTCHHQKKKKVIGFYHS